MGPAATMDPTSMQGGGNPLEDILAMALAAGYTPEQLIAELQAIVGQGDPSMGEMDPMRSSAMPGMDPMAGFGAGSIPADPMSGLNPMAGLGMPPSSDPTSGLPMMARGGTTRNGNVRILGQPTKVEGNSAVIPLTRDAKNGASSGADIAQEDVLSALSVLPTKLRNQYMENIARMGFDLITHGNKAKQKIPQQAIAGEAGAEIQQPAYFAEGGVTSRYVLDPEELSDQDTADTEFEKALRKAQEQIGQLSPEGQENLRIQVNQNRRERGLDRPVEGVAGGSPTNPIMPAGPIDIPQQPASDDPIPTTTPSPDPAKVTEPTSTGFTTPTKVSGGRNPAEWRFSLKENAWIPRNPPPGAAGSTPNTAPVDLAAIWDYLDPQELFPGVSKEWANQLYRMGPGYGEASYGDPAVGAAADASLQAARAGYSAAPKDGTKVPVSVGTGTSPTATGTTGSTNPATGTTSLPTGTTTPGSTTPTPGKTPATTGTKQDEEEFVMVNGEKVPLSVARGLLGDLDAGNNQFRAEADRRAARIASGDLTPTTLNRKTLNLEMALPKPDTWGKPQISPLTGAQFMFKPTEDGPENPETGKRTASGTSFDLYLSNGQGGFDKVSTLDMNNTKQTYAYLMGGANPAVETNPEWVQNTKSDLRSRVESDPQMAAALRGAVSTYDSPEEQNRRGQEAYRKLVDTNPEERRKLASELQIGGQLEFKPEELNIPRESLVKVNADGREQFVSGVQLVKRLDDGKDGSSVTKAIVKTADGRYYEYIQGQPTFRLTDENGNRVGDSASTGGATGPKEALPGTIPIPGTDVTAKPTNKTDTGVPVFEGSDGKFYWKDDKDTWFRYPDGVKPNFEGETNTTTTPTETTNPPTEDEPTGDAKRVSNGTYPATARVNGVTVERIGSGPQYRDANTGVVYTMKDKKLVRV